MLLHFLRLISFLTVDLENGNGVPGEHNRLHGALYRMEEWMFNSALDGRAHNII